LKVPSEPLKVLVIDDDPTILEIIKATLEDRNYVVTVRREPLGTTAQVGTLHPDFVILDINMPALSGDHIAEILLKSGRIAPECIVFYSASAETELVKLARRHNAGGWIRKDGDTEAFAKKFDAIVQQSRTRRLGTK